MAAVEEQRKRNPVEFSMKTTEARADVARV